MPVKDKTNWSAVDGRLNGEMRRIATVLIRIAEYLGELFVTLAREGGNYKDRTGNLRSSVHALVTADGTERYSSDRPTVMQGAVGTATGADAARQMAAQRQRPGINLIGVAGMPYGVYVERLGFRVASFAAIQTEARVIPLIVQSFKDIRIK